ncbi:MAG: glucosaminidase domain-containing protein [Prolixibacteraceae bacterium]|nr:glucosaminidase domain-containing protein [Prolixibacteraceae bacterium]
MILLLCATVVILFSWLDEIEIKTELNIQHVHLDSIHKVIPIIDSLVVPVLYDSLIIQKFVTSEERKQQFINQVLPAILIVKYQLENNGREVHQIIEKIEKSEPLDPNELAFADSLMIRFRAKTYENLLTRLKPHPVSLVLAQAAVESGWGSSRFALEGNNLFGIWTTPSDPSMMKSRFKRDEQPIYVKKYLTVAESIDHYFLTIGRHNAYRQFRNKRYEEANVFQLLETLDRYSEKGEDYTFQLRKMIEWNDLQVYDYYVIDPKYIVEMSFLDRKIRDFSKHIKRIIKD